VADSKVFSDLAVRNRALLKPDNLQLLHYHHQGFKLLVIVDVQQRLSISLPKKPVSSNCMPASAQAGAPQENEGRSMPTIGKNSLRGPDRHRTETEGRRDK
jgi:hypothetical protein